MNAQIKFYVKPRSSENKIIGYQNDAIKLEIKASPVREAANKELIRFLSKKLGISKSRIKIISGHHSRVKYIRFESLDQTEILRSLHFED